MDKVRKTLPVSLKRSITERNRNKGAYPYHVEACNKAIRVYDYRTAKFIGNAYFMGKGIYFSRHLERNIRRLNQGKSLERSSDDYIALLSFLEESVLFCRLNA